MPENLPEHNYDYHLITTEEQLVSLCEELEQAEIIAVDTETEGIEYSDIIVGIALSHKEGSGYYIPIRHEAVDGIKYPDQLEPAFVYKVLGPILESKPITGHNSKFDLKMFWKDGININYTDDTLIMAHILGVDAGGKRGLKPLVQGIFGHEMNDIDSLFPKVGRKKPEIRPKILSPTDIEFYGCEDGHWSLRLYNALKTRLDNYPKMKFIYNIEMRLLRVVAEMESFGVPVSFDFLEENSNKAEDYLTLLESSILETIREEVEDPEYEINLGSPKQLGTLLYDHLGLPILKHTATGNPSTDAATLKALAKDSPVVQSIMTFRELKKLNNTYLKGLQSKVDSDMRIRGNFNQVGTASGRFSSSNPNLQNLPKDQTFTLWPVEDEDVHEVEEHFLGTKPPLLGKTDEGEWAAYNAEVDTWDDGYMGKFNGKEYGVSNGQIHEMWRCKTRDFIEAPPDHYLIEVDYSQVELRIMAGESREPTLLEAYATGEDVHKATTAVVFDIPIEEVTKEQRHVGKTINFSLLYGAGPFNISQQLNIEVEEAEALVDRYFKNLPSILSWINRVKADTKMDGYAETVFGRRRTFPNVRDSSNFKLQNKELREAVNHHIQGAAADIMKTALVRTAQMLRKFFGDKAKIVSTVHDSALIECHMSCDPDAVIRVLQDAMENITISPTQLKRMKEGEKFEVTVVDGWPHLSIDADVGASWGSSEPYEVDPRADLPEPVDTSTLPDIRVRKIAIERETQDSDDDVRWKLHIMNPMDAKSVDWLKSFLDERKNDSVQSTVTLAFPDDDGEVVEKTLEGRYKLEFGDDVEIRMNVGPCQLVQDIEALDYGEVLRGVDFGI